MDTSDLDRDLPAGLADLFDDVEFTPAQRRINELTERLGVPGAAALFVVFSIVSSESVTLVISQFVKTGWMTHAMTIAIPALVTPPVAFFLARLVRTAQRLRERSLRVAAAYRELALQDQLTGLLNRRGLFAAIDALNPSAGVLLGVADLDSFKSINDCYGHEVGDLALIAVSRELVALAGPSGKVARTGGDEFVLARCEDDAADTPPGSTPNRLQVPVTPDLAVQVSLGWQRLSGRDIDHALGLADRNMYRSKQQTPSASPLLCTQASCLYRTTAASSPDDV